MAREKQEASANEMKCFQVTLPTRGGNTMTLAEGYFPDEEAAKKFAIRKLIQNRSDGWYEKLVCEEITID